MENKKSKNGLKVAFITILIVAIGGIFGTCYFYNKSLKSNSTLNSSKILNIYGINSYYNNSESLYICEQKNNHCQDIILTINTETNKATIIGLIGVNKVAYGIEASKNDFSCIVYVDNGLKMYNINTKEYKTIDIGLSDEEIINNFENNKEKYNFIGKGFIYEVNNKSYYYDLEKDEKLFGDYNNLHTISSVVDVLWKEDYILNNYLYGIKDENIIILDIKNKKEILKKKKDEQPINKVGTFTSSCQNEQENPFFVVYFGEEYNLNGEIYDKNGKLITKLQSDENIVVKVCQATGNNEGFSIYKNTLERQYTTNGELIN